MRGFSLVELLVVIGTIGILTCILLPTLGNATRAARRATCLGNLRSIGQAIRVYAINNGSCIPFGPKARRMMTATDFYPSTGAVTSLVSTSTGELVGLGLMLPQELARQPEILFCPGSDQPVNAQAELQKAGRRQAQSSYYYRHASVTRRFDPPKVDVLSPANIMLEDLGENRRGQPVRALVMDTQFLVPPGFVEFGITPRTHHRRQWANTLYVDGHASSLPNSDGRFIVNLNSYESLYDAFGRILNALEAADEIN